jgi:hypothetical protein
VGNVKGFQVAGKAAEDEARKIDALIIKIQQLRAAHAQAGTMELKASIGTDFGAAQDQLRAVQVPTGSTNTADIQAALAPLQAIQHEAPQAADAVDKASKQINDDIEGIGAKAPAALSEVSREAWNTLRTVGAITEEEEKVLIKATGILEQYQKIEAEGEAFCGRTPDHDGH